MKRLLVFVFALIIVTGFSQSNEKSLSVGFKGGPTLSSFSKEQLDWGYVLKHSSGISIRYLINQKLAFETGISYEAKGSSMNLIYTDNYGSVISEEKTLYNRNYLTLPMLASVYFGKKTKFGANLGPYFSYLISYNQSVPYLYQHLANIIEYQNTPNTIDLGIILGLYSNIKVTEKILINLEIRNSFGFLGLRQYYGGYASNNQTHTLLLGLEYLIN